LTGLLAGFVLALGHSPLEFNVHESHFGPRETQMVCLAKGRSNYHGRLPVAMMETYLTKADEHVVDFTMQLDGKPRLEIQPGFFRLRGGPLMPPQSVCDTVNMHIHANTEISAGASETSSKVQ